MPSSLPLNVGVLGCANIAVRSLMPAFYRHPAFTLAAIASRTPEKAASLAAQYGCRARTYAELVDDPDIEAVYIPLPTGLHFEWVMKALSAGKHVLCEKSLGCTRDEVERMVGLAREKGRLLMESFQFRFHSQHAVVKDLLAQGVIGEVRCLRSSFGFPPFADGAANIRYQRALGGGALLDAGAYTIKATTFLLGEAFRVRAATLRMSREHAVDVGGAIYLEGAACEVAETAFGFDHFYQCNYEIWGSRGKVTARRAFTAPPGYEPELVVETASGTDVRKLPADDHFDKLLAHFAGQAAQGAYEDEHRQNLTQARLLEEARNLAGIG